MAEEVENADFTVKLLLDMNKKEYVMVKRQEEVNIYTLSLVGQVNEIADDISYEEYRDIIYAKLDKEALEHGFKPRRMDCLKFLTAGDDPTLPESDKVLMELRGKFINSHK
ncbi:MAG: hypothetical protein H6Q70_3843 [Firmicutes bacterium]|nr:hypothetical protein [Bacillota bacterium]